MCDHKQSAQKSRVVIKIGTSSLINSESGCLNLRSIASLAESVRRLHDSGKHEVVVVSSGAVGVGVQKLGLEQRPTGVAQRQALAAVGQGHLMRYWHDVFTACQLTCAQVLLTLDNLADRSQYFNAENTFEELFALGVVPIVNENDTVAIEQLCFGDNDTLAAKVATLVRADWVFLLTDVDCLYTSNPNTDPNARPIHVVTDVSQLQVSTDGAGSSSLGTGGMETKITAAGLATAAGARMVICQADPELVPQVVLDGQRHGTVFLPPSTPSVLDTPKRWLLAAPAKGRLELQPDSVEVLLAQQSNTTTCTTTTTTEVAGDGTTTTTTTNACTTDNFDNVHLLAGVTAACIESVDGDFAAGDAVTLVCSESGRELGRGMAEIASTELQETLDAAAQATATATGSAHSNANIAACKAALQVVVCSSENACILPSVAPSVASSGSIAAISEHGSEFGDDGGMGSLSLTNTPRSMSPAITTFTTTASPTPEEMVAATVAQAQPTMATAATDVDATDVDATTTTSKTALKRRFLDALTK